MPLVLGTPTVPDKGTVLVMHPRRMDEFPKRAILGNGERERKQRSSLCSLISPLANLLDGVTRKLAGAVTDPVSGRIVDALRSSLLFCFSSHHLEL